MSEPDFDRLNATFDQVLRMEGRERDRFIADLMQEEPALAVAVERLLAADAHPDDLLRGPIGRIAASVGDPGNDYWVGRRLGAYRVLRRIATGGMGAVFLAERTDGQFEQQVALKVMGAQLLAADAVARFRDERQILANLNHPNIAQLLDGGTTETDLPYLVMEYIPGVAIDRYCDEQRLDLRARLALFQTVCDAVDYAHRKLVVHRDIKPSNVLVTADGVPKLVDFGIAKLLDAGAAAAGKATVAGQRPMTPVYASPEQVRGEPVSIATDVYSLGVLLYKLLSGRLPFRLPFRESRELPSELSRLILEQEPSRPSAAVLTPTDWPDEPTEAVIGASRRTTAARLRSQLAGDLDNIVLGALRKEPERRYRSAREFAQDVARYLDHQPVLVRGDAWSYRVRKFIRRHLGGLATATAVMITVVGLVGFYTYRLAEQRDLAERERNTADAVADYLVGIFNVADPTESRGEALSARQMLDRASQQLAGAPVDDTATRARFLFTLGRVYDRLGVRDVGQRYFEEALELQRQALGADDPALADTLRELGAVLLDESGHEEASQKLDEAIAIYRKRYGASHASIADALLVKALHAEQQGNMENALALCEQAGDMAAAEGASLLHASTLSCQGRLHSQLDRFDVADELFRRAAGIYRATSGDDHPSLLQTLSDWAGVDYYRGDFLAAAERVGELITIHERVLGADHPTVAMSLLNQAAAYRMASAYEPAGDAVERAIAIVREKIGTDSRAMTSGLHTLAEVRRQQGNAGEAERLLNQALEIQRRILPPVHREVGMSYANLATLLSDQGRYEQAGKAFEAAIDILSEALGPDHQWTVSNIAGYGVHQVEAGELAAGVDRLEDALQRAERADLSATQVGVKVKHYLARARRAEGDQAASLALLDEAEAGYRALSAKPQAQLAEIARDRSLAYQALGRLDLARARIEEAIALNSSAIGADNGTVGRDRVRLARVLDALGSRDEALAEAEAGVAIMAARFVPDHIALREGRAFLEELRRR